MNKLVKIDLFYPKYGLIRLDHNTCKESGTMDKLRAIQTFVAIAEQGSLSKAAQVLNSSLPATVRNLAALEENLGVRLLNRTTRRQALTEEGREYLLSCRDILNTIKQAELRLHAQQDEPSGLLVITASVLFGQFFVSPVLTRFLQHYPKVQCRLLLLDRIVNMHEEGIDLGIRIGALEESNLIAQQVGQVRRIVVASPSYLHQHGVPQNLADLAYANCVIFSGNGRRHWLFQEQGREKQIQVSGNLECNHGIPAIDACISGVGIGQFLSYQVADHLAAGRLKEILQPFALPAQPISIVYPHAGLLPSRIRTFIQWIKQDFADKDSLTPTHDRPLLCVHENLKP